MASWARAARIACAQAGRSLLRTHEEQLSRGANQCGKQTRGFASGHGAHDSVTYEGLTLHKPARWQVMTGKGLAGLMWFWIFYRLYNDFDHFVYGPAAHLEHELHEEAHQKEEHKNADVGEESQHTQAKE